MNLNLKLNWTLDSYHKEQQSSDAQVKHALIHMMKAVGQIAGIIEPFDHDARFKFDSAGLAKFLADTVICCVRIADLAGIDLEHRVAERMREKDLDPR